MRAVLPVLVLASLLVAPTASAYHVTISLVCLSDGGDGLVGDLHRLAVNAACGAYHIGTELLVDDVPFLVNAVCDILVGQPCI